MKEDKYIICKKIDEQRRYFGLTLDEFIPIFLAMAVLGFLVSLIAGLMAGGVVWFAIRHFKKGQGTNWFLNIMYWYLPLHFFKGIWFVKTPPSSFRHWLA